MEGEDEENKREKEKVTEALLDYLESDPPFVKRFEKRVVSRLEEQGQKLHQLQLKPISIQS